MLFAAADFLVMATEIKCYEYTARSEMLSAASPESSCTLGHKLMYLDSN